LACLFHGCSWQSLAHLYRASAFILFIPAWPVSQSRRQELTGTQVLFQLKDKTVLPATCISAMSKEKICTQHQIKTHGFLQLES